MIALKQIIKSRWVDFWCLACSVACGTVVGNPDEHDPEASFTTELQRMPGESFSDVQDAFNLDQAEASPASMLWTSEVKISSLVIPLRSIAIKGDAVYTTIYRCDESDTDFSTGCSVDLIGEALTNLLSDKSIATSDTGVFDRVVVVPKKEEQSNWDAELTAEFAINGVSYYTNKSSKLSTVGPAEPTVVNFQGSFSESRLAEPIVLGKADQQLRLRLFFDVLHLARAKAGVATSLDGAFCIEDSVGDAKLCLERPTVVATTSDEIPILEHYQINVASTASLYFHGSGMPLGGNFRPFYMQGVTAKGTNSDGVHFWNSGQIQLFEQNDDQSYVIGNFGSGTNEGSGFKASNFVRQDHSGTYVDDQDNVYTYQAKRID